jgi:hypothetical protein
LAAVTYDPAQYPDIKMYPGDVPISWLVTLRRQGQGVDVTNSTITALVYDDGVQVGALTVEKTNPGVGEVKLTVTQAVYDAVKRYSTWRLREAPIFSAVMVQGRLDKRL